MTTVSLFNQLSCILAKNNKFIRETNLYGYEFQREHLSFFFFPTSLSLQLHAFESNESLLETKNNFSFLLFSKSLINEVRKGCCTFKSINFPKIRLFLTS